MCESKQRYEVVASQFIASEKKTLAVAYLYFKLPTIAVKVSNILPTVLSRLQFLWISLQCNLVSSEEYKVRNSTEKKIAVVG